MSYKPADRYDLTSFIQSNTRFQAINIWGDMLKIADAQPLDSLSSVFLTNGISKLIIVVNAGSDLVGNITVNGTSVNRDTGATTGADSETVVINGATTDNTGTDPGGYTQWDFTNAYITSKWWTGSPTLDYDAGAPLTITDLDVYSCSFHQFNDMPNIKVTGFDINALANHASAAIYAHLYSVKPTTGSFVDVVSESDIELAAASVLSGRYYRLRRADTGGLPLDIDGTSEGIFANMNLERNAQAGDWTDMSIYLHAEQKLVI